MPASPLREEENTDGIRASNGAVLLRTDPSTGEFIVSDRDEFDLEDEEGEEFDELRVDYSHDEDDHDYRVLVRSFEDGEDADAYHEAVEDAVEDADYEEDPGEDAYVYRDGDTVVYIHGDAGSGDYGTYDFEALRTQY